MNVLPKVTNQLIYYLANSIYDKLSVLNMDSQQQGFDDEYPELSHEEIILFAHCALASTANLNHKLSINDSDLNQKQTSQYYARRRRGKNNAAKEKPESMINQQAKYPLQTFSQEKLGSLKQSNSQLPKHPHSNKVERIQEPLINESYSKKQGSETSRKEVPKVASRKKIQIVPNKRVEEKAGSFSFKEYEKFYLNNYQSQLNSPPREKIHLSEFMHANKKEKTPQSHETLSHKKSKNQKCADPQKLSKTDNSFYKAKNSNSSHQNFQKDQAPLQSQLKLAHPREEDYSKSKSKSKAKRPKQSSFYKPIKNINSSTLYGPIRREVMPQQEVLNNYSANYRKSSDLKNVKQNSIMKQKIKIKCEDRIPVQILPDSQHSDNQEQEQQYFDYNQEEVEQFKTHKKEAPPSAKSSEHEKQNQIKDQTQNSYLDYYAVDMGAFLNKQVQKEKEKHKKQPSELVIAQKLQSHEIGVTNLNGQKSKDEKKEPIVQQQQKSESKPIKSSRKKIFQSIPAKPQQKASSQDAFNDLTDSEMRMLLGVKGNKYKQAIVLQYIKENRKGNQK